MAGTNRVLKDGQVLFVAGDASDGMYLIRRGSLRVYLEQNGKEVTLATVPAGAMIGEMALFDQQPRSASVKAVGDTEVTLISTQDFNKLMKQIPKWFVGLMSALSSRLRQTNERLQKLENDVRAGGKGFQGILRTLNTLILIWHKDGTKDGKEWLLEKKSTEQVLTNVFGENTEEIRLFFEILVKENFLLTRQDSYRNVVFTVSNRAVLDNAASFLSAYAKDNPKQPCLPQAAMDILSVLEEMTMASPYDTVTVSLDDLIKEGKRRGMVTTTWKDSAQAFKTAGESVKLVKTSAGLGFRTTKKEISPFVRHHRLLGSLYKANLI